MKKALKAQVQNTIAHILLGVQNLNLLFREYVKFARMVADFLSFDQKKEELAYILKGFVYVLSSLKMLRSESYQESRVKGRGGPVTASATAQQLSYAAEVQNSGALSTSTQQQYYHHLTTSSNADL